MIHPIFRLLVSEPQLLADHVEAYAELVTEEVGASAQSLKRRVIMTAAAGGLLLVGVLFAAIALMLWGASADDSMRAPWVLWLVPGVPIVGGIVCWFMGKKAAEGQHGLSVIKEQFAADTAMLRSVRAGS